MPKESPVPPVMPGHLIIHYGAIGRSICYTCSTVAGTLLTPEEAERFNPGRHEVADPRRSR